MLVIGTSPTINNKWLLTLFRFILNSILPLLTLLVATFEPSSKPLFTHDISLPFLAMMARNQLQLWCSLMVIMVVSKSIDIGSIPIAPDG